MWPFRDGFCTKQFSLYTSDLRAEEAFMSEGEHLIYAKTQSYRAVMGFTD